MQSKKSILIHFWRVSYWGKVKVLLILAAMLGSGPSLAWGEKEVSDIFSAIVTEMYVLQSQNAPSTKGEKDIIDALGKVFTKNSPMMDLANLSTSKGKKGKVEERIAAWQTVLDYVLWSVWFFDERQDLKFELINEFHQYFAPFRAFDALVRDYQFAKLKNYLQMEDASFLKDPLPGESPAVLAAKAEAVFQETSLQILGSYLFADGIMTLEATPYVFEIAPQNFSEVYHWRKMIIDAVKAPERKYQLNYWFSSMKKGHTFNFTNDPSVAEWLRLVNRSLKMMSGLHFANDNYFYDEFDHVNFTFNFDLNWQRDGKSYALSNTAQLKKNKWILDQVIDTSLAHITYLDNQTVKHERLVQVDFNVLPAALATTPALRKYYEGQWDKEILDASIHHAKTVRKPLRMAGRLAKFVRATKRGKVDFDQVINLIPTSRHVCAKNFLLP